ncbi:hypothetical protein B0A52_07569 [Exophiala mesophila]|uniref:Uncharacterized protein n=1 Tax=Exophiala mesophila TaxID=212818 RepID=A0A438MYV5_EXOME|nr:hypothetical protein B0A52_07569 [Exophiala mesophila]
MLAARDQENLSHAHRAAAAAKPLNQGIRALQPKTPGNLKTPFRASKNDENRPFEFNGQKGLLKDGPSKLDKTTFVTPLGPRNRAPLGQKTTNAKSRAFQTPGPAPLTNKPLKTVQKHSSARRSARSKITIAQAEPTKIDILTNPPQEDNDIDYGYAPPPPVELPDLPLEVIHDPLMDEAVRDYCDTYLHSPKDESGVSLRLKREEEEYQQWLKQEEQKLLKGLDQPSAPTSEELNKQVDDMIAAGPKRRRPALSRVDSMQARSAAAALSEPQPCLPAVVTKPTKASEQKQRGYLPINRTKTPTPAPLSSRSGHAAISKNTIGFPRAKKAPSIIPRGLASQRSGSTAVSKPIKIDQSKIHPRDFRDLYGSPPEESDMWFRLKEYELLEEDIAKDDAEGLADELFEADFFPFDNSKLDDEDFQLPMPE